MKTLNLNILKFYSRLLAAILFVFGIGTGCEKVNPAYGTPVPMYGAPYAKYKISGTIKSDSTDNVIPSIKVVTTQDSTFSDANGNYQIQINANPGDQSFVIHFADADGVQNGLFHDKDTVAQFTNPQFSGGDGEWYAGETSKQLNVKLKPE